MSRDFPSTLSDVLHADKEHIASRFGAQKLSARRDHIANVKFEAFHRIRGEEPATDL
jgi:hypothetical protein